MPLVESYLYDCIGKAVISEYSPGFWGDMVSEFVNRMTAFRPDLPDDGSTGYLAFNQPGKDNRMKIKTGRFLCKKLQLNNGLLSEPVIQALTEKINNELFPNMVVKLCNGAEITKNYKDAVGSRSCMTGGNCEYTKLYENNPDRFFQLVVYWGNDSARAMLYKLDNGEFLLGRRYASAEITSEKLKEYAAKKNWCDVYKEGKCQDDMIMSNLKYKEGEVPYMDVLSFYHITDNGLLTITHNPHERTEGELTSTEGYFADRNVCCCCEGDIINDESYYNNDEIYCESCYSENFTCCEICDNDVENDYSSYVDSAELQVCEDCLSEHFASCEICGEFYRSDDLIEPDTGGPVCDNCLDEHFTECEICGELHRLTDFVSTFGTTKHICETCFVTYFLRCDKCGEFIHKDNLSEHDGEFYCDNCCNVEVEVNEPE